MDDDDDDTRRFHSNWNKMDAVGIVDATTTATSGGPGGETTTPGNAAVKEAVPRDVNANACVVDRALASATMRLEAIDGEISRLSAECARAVTATCRRDASSTASGGDEEVGVEVSAETRERAEKTLNALTRRLYALHDEKVSLAQAAYDCVDDHINKLDKDLSTFEETRRAEDKDYDAKAVRNGPNPIAGSVGVGDGADGDGAGGNVYDAPMANPNEPTYCVCNQVSFGEMIACENDSCPIEWYHFSCVGLNPTKKIKGKWICSTCKAAGAKR